MKTLSRQEIEEELIAIATMLAAESGDVYRHKMTMDASLQKHLGIDSLARAELFHRIEQRWKIHLSDKIFAEAETLKDIADFLETAPLNNDIVVHGRSKQPDSQQQIDMLHAQSLVDVLRIYAERLPHKIHIYFQQEDGTEEIITYGKLWQMGLKVAGGLRERGLKAGETVAIMLPSHPNFFYVFFGVMLAGGIPVPVYPPFRAHLIETYAKTEAKILKNAEVRMLVTFTQAEHLSHLLQGFVPSLKAVVSADELIQSQAISHPALPEAENYAFIQYTSGSTADPKGVLLTHQNLLANIRAYGQAINVQPTDVAVSWLPLYHDMGLIGMWFGSLYFGIPLVLLAPFTFLNRPERWLWAIHYHRGTLSAAPNFAYELCVRKIDTALIEGLDLSSWRMAANGAEKVYPETLRAFAQKFTPFGLKPDALLPVYGLAESTVGLAIPPLGRPFKTDRVDRDLFDHARVAHPATGENTLEFVACGKAIPGHQIRIVDDDNQPLLERHVGNLQFKGPSSMQGYYHNPQATSEVYHDDWFDTGDLAYIAEEELYITGRKKDLIIKAGRNLYPAEIEAVAGTVPGVREGCVAAFAVADQRRGSEKLIIVAETRERNRQRREQITEDIRSAILEKIDIAPDHIELVSPRTVPKTSSGKLQRALCKKMYLDEKLHKWRMPVWLQVSKLMTTSFVLKSLRAMKWIGKFIYTLYVIVLMMLTLIPLRLALPLLRQEQAASGLRMWARLLALLCGCRLEITGKSNLTEKKPVIYTSNHASYIDAIVLLAILPPGICFVGKKELLSMPIIRAFMRKLDYLAVDRTDLPKGIEDTKQMAEMLKSGRSILIFPEGTFSYAAGLRPFRMGAFKIAAETNTPICPIALNGTRQILRSGEKWMSPHPVLIHVSSPMLAKGTEWQDITHLRHAVRAEIAAHCGEPSLDYIAAQTVAVDKKRGY